MEIIPNWHPVVVHFSVALLVTATLLLSWALIQGRVESSDKLVSSGRLVLWLGLVAIVVTVVAGLQAYYSVNHDSPSHLAMTNHRNWAFMTLVAFAISGFMMWRKRKDQLTALTVWALVLSTGLLLSTAYRGGELVYKYGIGVQSLPVVSGEGHDHEHAEGEGHDDVPKQDESQPHEHAEGEDHEETLAPAKEHEHTDGVSDDHGDPKKEEEHAPPDADLLILQ